MTRVCLSSEFQHAATLLLRIFARLVVQAHVVTALFPLAAFVIAVTELRGSVPLVSPGTVRSQWRAALLRRPFRRHLVPRMFVRLIDAEPEPGEE